MKCTACLIFCTSSVKIWNVVTTPYRLLSRAPSKFENLRWCTRNSLLLGLFASGWAPSRYYKPMYDRLTATSHAPILRMAPTRANNLENSGTKVVRKLVCKISGVLSPFARRPVPVAYWCQTRLRAWQRFGVAASVRRASSAFEVHCQRNAALII